MSQENKNRPRVLMDAHHQAAWEQVLGNLSISCRVRENWQEWPPASLGPKSGGGVVGITWGKTLEITLSLAQCKPVVFNTSSGRLFFRLKE